MKKEYDIFVEEESDPRSYKYKRILVRPKINWLKTFLFIIVSIIYFYFVSKYINIFIGLTIYGILTIRLVTIWSIMIYQRYAPDNIRNRCRFEPSCSNYMLLAIKKYGFIKGVIKGLNHIHRCSSGDGGYELP